ncbi:MAG: sodium/proton-translocating pyrophosphatase [Acidimicrobiia bacterium]
MRGVLASDQGTPSMIEIAGAIQEGAMAYLKRQFETIAVILVPLAIVVFVTSTEVVKPLTAPATRRPACRSCSPVRSGRSRSSPAVCCRASPASSA